MMKNKIRIRVQNSKDGGGSFKAIILHPMETGRCVDDNSGELIGADYIKRVQLSVNDVVYMDMDLGREVSSNPFLMFDFVKPFLNRQHMHLSWFDNQSREFQFSWVVAFDDTRTFNAGTTKKSKTSEIDYDDFKQSCRNAVAK